MDVNTVLKLPPYQFAGFNIPNAFIPFAWKSLGTLASYAPTVPVLYSAPTINYAFIRQPPVPFGTQGALLKLPRVILATAVFVGGRNWLRDQILAHADYLDAQNIVYAEMLGWATGSNLVSPAFTLPPAGASTVISAYSGIPLVVDLFDPTQYVGGDVFCYNITDGDVSFTNFDAGAVTFGTTPPYTAYDQNALWDHCAQAMVAAYPSFRNFRQVNYWYDQSTDPAIVGAGGAALNAVINPHMRAFYAARYPALAPYGHEIRYLADANTLGSDQGVPDSTVLADLQAFFGS